MSSTRYANVGNARSAPYLASDEQLLRRLGSSSIQQAILAAQRLWRRNALAQGCAMTIIRVLHEGARDEDAASLSVRQLPACLSDHLHQAIGHPCEQIAETELLTYRASLGQIRRAWRPTPRRWPIDRDRSRRRRDLDDRRHEHARGRRRGPRIRRRARRHRANHLRRTVNSTRTRRAARARRSAHHADIRRVAETPA